MILRIKRFKRKVAKNAKYELFFYLPGNPSQGIVGRVRQIKILTLPLAGGKDNNQEN
jgi:hypothetical protein